MNNHPEQGGNLETGVKRFGEDLRIRATLALSNIIDSLPHIKKKNVGRALAAGAFGLLEAACAAKPVLQQSTAAIETKTPESTPLPGLFFNVLSADQKSPNPIPQDLLQQLDNKLTNNNRLNPNHSPVTVSEIVGVEAVDPENPKKTAGFFFVETNQNQSEKNNPHFVMFKDNQGHVIVNSYKAFASVGPDGQVDVIYWTGGGKVFLTIHLAETLAPGEDANVKLKDPEFQKKLGDDMNKGAITGMDLSNPYTKDEVTLSNANQPGVLARAIDAFQQYGSGLFAIPVANAAEPQANTAATPQPSSTPPATATQEATATATAISSPTSIDTATPQVTPTEDPQAQLQEYLQSTDGQLAVSNYLRATLGKEITKTDIDVAVARLSQADAQVKLKDGELVIVDPATADPKNGIPGTPLFKYENTDSNWSIARLGYLGKLDGVDFGFAVHFGDFAYHKYTQQDYDLIASEASLAAPEDAFMWSSLRWKGPDEFTWQASDQFVNWAVANNLKVRAQNLIWDKDNYPDWFMAEIQKAKSNTNKQEVKNIFIKYMNDYLTAVGERYKGKIAEWVVLNELFDDNGNLNKNNFWVANIGPDIGEIAINTLRQQIGNSGQIVINDGKTEIINPRSTGLYNYVKDLKDRGILHDGDAVGFQFHTSFKDSSITKDNIKANFRRFAKLGLKIKITEMDMFDVMSNDPATLKSKADKWRSIVEAALEINEEFGNNVVDDITVWGLKDDDTWYHYIMPNQAGYPLMFDKDDNPELVYFDVKRAFLAAALKK